MRVPQPSLPPLPRYRCRLCSVQVIGRDRDGHLRRQHGASGGVTASFEEVRNA